MKRILKYSMFLESVKFNPDVLSNFFKKMKVHFFSQLIVEENGVVIYDSDLILKGDLNNELGFPIKIDIIKGNFDISDCELTTLEGCPNKIINTDEISHYNSNPSFTCNNNKNLKNLTGGPSQVDGEYSVINCGLTSLVGSPTICKGDFCANSNNLEDFTGLSEIRCDGDIYLVKNPLYSFNGLPELCKNQIYINYTPLNEVWTLMQKNQHALQLAITYPFIGKVDGQWVLNPQQFEDICSDAGVNLPENWRESIKSYQLYE